MKAQHLQQGEDAEAACCSYLQSHGLKLIEKNFSCRLGEIDIIMHDRDMLVFVEVRFRRNNAFGGGLESVTRRKQHKLRQAAEFYLQQKSRYKNARIDVVSMALNSGTGDRQYYSFDWIKNAF